LKTLRFYPPFLAQVLIDGQGVNFVIQLLPTWVNVPPPSTTNQQMIDVWWCDHSQDGPGGTVTVNAGQPILFANGLPI
jgi:hypothetical protein